MTGYSAYKTSSITTASPYDLVMQLYDGCIKFCNQAKTAIDNKNIEEANNYLLKAQNIVVELRSSLDMSLEISKEFDRLYEFCSYSLEEANIKKDKEHVDNALYIIREFKDIWKQLKTK